MSIFAKAVLECILISVPSEQVAEGERVLSQSLYKVVNSVGKSAQNRRPLLNC